MQIEEAENTGNSVRSFSLFNLGFRIFFLAAGLFAIISMAVWSAIFHFDITFSFGSIASSQWHAHEMIYGYSLAVIAGFLLTAVKNWTGVQTVTGKLLAGIFGLWVLARFLFMFGEQYLLMAAVFDFVFLLSLLSAVIYPVVKVKQWNQSIIIVILTLLLTFNSLFYLAALGVINNGVYWGNYGGLYLIIGLVLVMARRVIPFFIERGVDYEVKLINSKWIDASIIGLLCLFVITELFVVHPSISAWSALGMFIVSSIRLLGWHTKGIWSKSMLWSIYSASWFISFGFLLIACSYFFDISKFLGIHALSVGGIGLITMGMMARVALGHTGRDISQPSAVISYALGMLVIAAVVRVVLPLVNPENYILWVGISQLLWIIAFTIFTIVYLPILSKPRIDNQPG